MPAEARERAIWVAIGLLPWSWFAIRNLSPGLDAVAIGLPVLVAVAVIALAVIGVVSRRRGPWLATVSWLAVGGVAVLGPWAPLRDRPPSSGMRIVESNQRSDGSGQAATDILRQDPDIVVVTELSATTDVLMRQRFSNSAHNTDPPNWGGDVGLYSRWPVTGTALPSALAGQRALRAVVQGPSGPFVIYAVHLGKPVLRPGKRFEMTFTAYHRLIDQLRTAVRAERLPTLVVGDLNMVDRTSSYRAMGHDLSDAMRADWVGPTSRRAPIVPLLARIDQIFMPKTWCSTDSATFTLSASDHQGIVVTLGPC